MRRRQLIVPLLAATTVAVPTAHAELIGAHMWDLGDLGAGVSTWRVFLDFSSPADQLLAIVGDAEVRPLVFSSASGSPLRNTTGPFQGLCLEDTPLPGLEAWDSWVTIGATEVPLETQFTPGFLGGDGMTSVIHGTSFSESNGGGWFDSDPGTPETGGSILIAQLTLGTALFSLEGTAEWISGDDGQLQRSSFVAWPISPAPSSMLLLFGIAARRRRRR